MHQEAAAARSAEQAARETGLEEFQARRVLTITSAHAVHDTYTAFLPPLLPILVPMLALSTTRAGLLAIFLQTPWLLQPFIGRMADRGLARRFTVAAPAFTGVAMCLLGVAPTYGMVALLLLLAGLGSAGIHATAPALVGRLSGDKLGKGMGFWMVGGELGRTLGPVILVGAVGALTLGGLPWLMVGGLAMSVVLHFALKGAPRSTSDTEPLPWGRVLRTMAPLLVPLSGIMMARMFLHVSLTVYLPLFLHREGAELWLAGIALAVVEAAGVVGALLGGTISDRWGRRAVLALALTVTPIAVALFFASSGWIRFPLLLVAGFFGLSTTPVIMALIQETHPDQRAVANGIYMVLNFGVRSAGVLSMGLASDGLGSLPAVLAACGISLLGLPLLRWLPVRARLSR